MRTCVRTVLLFAVWVAVATAQTTVDKHLATKPGDVIEIDNRAGLTKVEGWDRDEVHVTGKLGKDVVRIDLERFGNRVLAKVVCPPNKTQRGGFLWLGRYTVRQDVASYLHVRVPAGSPVQVQSSSANVEASKMTESLDAQTSSGDVTVNADLATLRIKGSSGNMKVEGHVPLLSVATISGDITFDGSSEEATLETSSGDIRIGGDSGRIEAGTVSGDIRASGSAEEVDVSATSGDIEVRTRCDVLKARASSGSIAAEGVQREARARSVSGNVIVSAGNLKYGEFKTVSGTVRFKGDIARGGSLDMATTSGDVRVNGRMGEAAMVGIASTSGDVGLTLTEPVDAVFSFETSSGDLNVGLDIRGGLQTDGRRKTFSVGTGSGRVNVRTSSGDMRVYGAGTRTTP